jgi:uracil-DNA glycosylase family 4
VARKRKPRFADWDYWAKPVPGFGDVNAELVVVGLAPAAHGGLRTGRVFTGDSSGRFLVRALHRAGFASQATSESKDDGLMYTNCYVTAAVKCSPPGDRPSRNEFDNCAPFLDAELRLLRKAKIVLTLGSFAFRAVVDSEKRRGSPIAGARFVHDGRYPITGGRLLWASYHPSPRNTNTGKLTEEMFVGLLLDLRDSLRDSRR